MRIMSNMESAMLYCSQLEVNNIVIEDKIAPSSL